MNIFLTLRKLIYINGRTTKRHLVSHFAQVVARALRAMGYILSS